MVPIPLLPPLPPNDSGLPRDPCGSVVENLLDFLLFYHVLIGIAIRVYRPHVTPYCNLRCFESLALAQHDSDDMFSL